MRAALAVWGAEDALEPIGLAAAALAAETEILHIAAGLADRAVQVWGVPVLTDVRRRRTSGASVRPATPIQLQVIWNEAAAAPSDDYHRALRALVGDDRIWASREPWATWPPSPTRPRWRSPPETRKP